MKKVCEIKKTIFIIFVVIDCKNIEMFCDNKETKDCVYVGTDIHQPKKNLNQ